MAITRTDITARWSEFSSLDSDVLDLAIADAYEQLDPDVWENKLDRGALYLAAHLAKLGASGAVGSAGPVQSESVGQVSRSYAVAQLDSGDTYESTGYGRLFLGLLMSLPNARFGVA